MEGNLNPWFHHQLSHQQSSYLNSLSHPFNLGTLNDIPPSMSPCAYIASLNGTFTEIASSGVPYPKQCQPNVSHGWFYGLPHNDGVNTLSHEKAPCFPLENHKETITANPLSVLAQKRFIVFDQSGDQTTMFFTPGISPPVRITSEDPKLNCNDNANKIVETDTFHHEEPILTYEYHHENLKDDGESVMREDTEELNALLYSDDDYYYEDEEEASTGHSPSTMTGFDKKEWADEDEEVASNFEPNKRIKLSNGDFEASPLVDSASFGKLKNCSECEDAESSCGDDEDHNLVGKKRSRKDKIKEAVSLLQSIIPGGKGKGNNAVMIFDEAIDYLKSLKLKAQALGVHTI